MAKSKTKEAGTPLIFALVFFILTTVAFGVMWYLAYSDVEQAKANEKKAKDDLKGPRDQARDAELKARTYRLYMGIEEGDDKTVVAAESRPGDVIASELNKINAAMAKKLGVPDAAGLPDDFKFWITDEKNKAGPPPAEGVTDQIAKLKNKDVAYKTADESSDAYKKQIVLMQASAKQLKDVQDKFQKEIDRLPTEFKTDLKKITDGFDARTKAYQSAEAAANKKINDVTEERDRLEAQIRKLKDRVATLESDNQALQVRATKAEGGKDAFVFDEPQGKILRKLPEGVVEISLGSAAGVKPGLTFTVLPSDFPEKGRTSRMKMLRVPDGKGGFKSVETFVPKGAIEVYEVVSPNLSLARIQAGTEMDPIRDGVNVGDLLYNSVWRKGVADHIALVGIFDVNGDGTDDIESVVRDLTKMGIPVDAYYDMKKRAWVGQITERTRFLVEGYMPINSALDPNREEKTKLLGAIGTAISEGKQKGVESVNFRDFFARMGYKYRLDVSDDIINKATAPYLSNVGVGGPVPMPPSP